MKMNCHLKCLCLVKEEGNQYSVLLASVHAECPCICSITDVTLCTVFPGALTPTGSIIANLGHGPAKAGCISFMPRAV